MSPFKTYCIWDFWAWAEHPLTEMTLCNCHQRGNTLFHRNEVLLSSVWEHCFYLPHEWGTDVGTLSLSSTGMRYCCHWCGNTVSIYHRNDVLLSPMGEHCLYLPQEWGTAVTDVGTLSLSSTGMRYRCHRCGNTVSIFHRNEVLLSSMWAHSLYLPQEWGTTVIGVGTVSTFHRNDVLQSLI